MTKPVAQQLLKKIMQEAGVNTAEHLARAIQPVELFEKKAERWLEEHRVTQGAYARFKPHTYRTMSSNVRKHLMKRFRGYSVRDVGAREVDALIAELAARPMSKSAIKQIVFTLGTVLERPIPLRDRLRKLKNLLPKKSRNDLWFTDEEMRQIVAVSKGRYKVIFATLRGTGLRSGELRGLRIEDVDLRKGFIHVQRSVFETREQSPKSDNAYRFVGIDKKLVEILREWIGKRKIGYLFPSNRGTPLQEGTILKFGLYKAFESLDFERRGRGLHAFRHGRVTRLVDAGVPIRTIKAWIGHGSEKMVEQYTHTLPEYHARFLALLDTNDTNNTNVEAVQQEVSLVA